MSIRMMPVDFVFNRFPRMVRDTAQKLGKQVRLETEGAQTELDKTVIEQITDPLTHLVRNSIDHGIESPEARVAAGKPEEGVVQLSAFYRGGNVIIQIKDDGKGLSRENIVNKAIEKGLTTADEAELLSDNDVWQFIFNSGFSTAAQVTDVSGRGVGMDVLNQTMKELRGRITVDSAEGKGTDVALHIPVSLAFLDCIILRLGSRMFAIPVDDIAEIVKPNSQDLVEISADSGAEMMRLRGAFVRVCRLEHFYEEDDSDLRPLSDMVTIVFKTTTGQIAVPVDEVLDRQQVVMKPMVGALANVRASWGCALLGTGEVAVVLDGERLSQGGAS